jgi:hypothetical protein
MHLSTIFLSAYSAKRSSLSETPFRAICFLHLSNRLAAAQVAGILPHQKNKTKKG